MHRTVTWIDKRAMDAIEHRQRTRELNSILIYKHQYANGGMPKFTPFELGHFNCAGEYVIPKAKQ